MKGKKVIVISVAVICAAAIGGYEYWKYEDTRKREAAYQAAKDSLILELQTDPTIEYGETIDDPKQLAMSYVKDSNGDVTVENSDAIDSGKTGTIDLKYTVSTKDSYGVEVSQSKDLTVTVQDTQAPEIVLESDSVSIQEGSEFDPLENVVRVKDSVDGDLDRDSLTVDNPVDTAVPGEYTVSISVADANGNTADVSYAVTVTPKPVVKKTTAAASSINTSADVSDQYSASDAGTASTDDGSVDSSNGDWRYTISNDIIGKTKDAYDIGKEHYEEGTAWGAVVLPDGSVVWEQDW